MWPASPAIRELSSCAGSLDTRTSTSGSRWPPPGRTQADPALARIWDAPIEPLDVEKLATGTEAVFLALPDSVSATLAPQLTARGLRVFDISGAFRLRDTELRKKWYPHSPKRQRVAWPHGALPQ